uniref:Uncharacterized protein n=1 Tax=Rhizophora mucronata TaxID=61149 RepID=A0A2P2QWU9_RHIMU
MNLNPFFHL